MAVDYPGSWHLAVKSVVLWPVSRIDDFPSKYIENLSQAHVKAKAYFSICA